MPQTKPKPMKIEVEADDLIKREVKKASSKGGVVYLPHNLIGKTVYVVLPSSLAAVNEND